MSKKKIAIVGTAPSSRDLAPFGDSSWTIWACSHGNFGLIPRFDAWFELHALSIIKGSFPDYFDALAAISDSPVFFREEHEDAPNSLLFPMAKYKAKYPHDFLSSSIAWLMAHAIDDSPSEIGIWGVDMADSTEYAAQRPGVLFFKHVAEMAGIRVTIPEQSDLNVQRRVYGDDAASPMAQKLSVRKAELEGRISAASLQRDELNREVVYLSGALDDLEYVIRSFT